MKKGFTLVELLAVIIILGIVVGISYPIVNKTIKSGKEQALKQTIRSIEDAANKYLILNEDGYLPIKKILTLDELKKSGLLDKEIKDSITNKDLNGCISYIWNKEFNQFVVKYEDVCDITLIDEIIKDYDEKKDNGLINNSKNEDEFFYKGDNSIVSNNYLWYGGHHWRIMGFNAKTNTIKLISQMPLTAISPSSEYWYNDIKYKTSYVNTWLNGFEDQGNETESYFWKSLNKNIKDNIKTSTFNVGHTGDVKSIRVKRKVGLLDYLQYQEAGGMNSYLDIKDAFLLGNTIGSSKILIVDQNGDINSEAVDSSIGVRPVIEIGNLKISSGDGTITNPYKTSNEDLEVGEYIKIKYENPKYPNPCSSEKCLFRIVEKDNEKIKIILNGFMKDNDFLKNEDKGPITINDNIYVNSLMKFISGFEKYRYKENVKYNVGYYNKKSNYKDVLNNYIMAPVGLPVVGEMFSGNDIDITFYDNNKKYFVDEKLIENPNLKEFFWLMNYRENLGEVVGSYDGYLASTTTTTPFAVRPTFYINANMNIISGDGSPYNPYELE